MLELILKTAIIFIVLNTLETLFLILFNVKKSIIASLLLNNILGIIILFVMNYYRVFIDNISVLDLLITASTGIFGTIFILVKLIIF